MLRYILAGSYSRSHFNVKYMASFASKQ